MLKLKGYQQWVLEEEKASSFLSYHNSKALLSTVIAVLTSEEQSLGLRQPTGVGARPRPMATELCNQNDPGTTDVTLPNTTIPISLPSSTNGKIMHFDSEFNDSYLGPDLYIPCNFKQQSTHPSMNVIESNLTGPFIDGCGDTVDSSNNQARLETIYESLQPKLWNDNLANNFAQLKLGDSFLKQEYQTSLNTSQMANAANEDAERLKFLTCNIDDNNRNNFRSTNSTFSFESLQSL
ncbi:unnamed protein product [Rodentolepis nana]|uniref:MADS-box domain-containing protein n=1 Tax=Rodentolepis nana TaxID=102285 RepID=A0A0R3TFN8_RODNA|nr:unnamed protein product [Rodentolepis nana]